jgi:hypothetical protein
MKATKGNAMRTSLILMTAAVVMVGLAVGWYLKCRKSETCFKHEQSDKNSDVAKNKEAENLI